MSDIVLTRFLKLPACITSISYVKPPFPAGPAPQWLPTSSLHCLYTPQATSIPHEDLADLAGLEVALQRADVVDDEGDLPEGAVDALPELDDEVSDGEAIDECGFVAGDAAPEEVEGGAWMGAVVPLMTVAADIAEIRPRLISIIINYTA